jgi:hypothetical protein
MSTGPASTSSPHLDLADLIAEVTGTGQAIDTQAREHLASCTACRDEASRWNLVADGVRSLAAVAPELAQPARPRLTGARVLAGPRRRTTMAASAAAVLVLVGGVGYGVTSALTGHAQGPAKTGPAKTSPAKTGTTSAGLTAVSGCDSLRQADGTLEQVNGTTLVVKTASGEQVTVTTTSATHVSMSKAPVTDITNGELVGASGHGSGGAIDATYVTLGAQPRAGIIEVPPGIVYAHGTVADASATGFTIVAADGTRVPVTISGDTNVEIPKATVSQLQIGAPTIAFGYPATDGTLPAIGVLSGRPGILDVMGCSPAQIDAAMTTALVSG